MASTYSTSLKLELIGDGEQSGIWGQTTNNNLGTLLEQAITGVVSITMTNANYTLSNLNGVSDESRNAVLVVGGTNAAVRDIIAPLVEKLYWVKNSTVGGFGVRIIGSSGAGVTVPSGNVTPVYCDGTNFYTLELTSTVGNFTVNGNLSVTGNTNAVAATYTGNVAALNISTANVAATGTGAFSGNVSALNISTANVTATGVGAFTGNVSAANFSTAGNVAATGNVSGAIATFTGNSVFSSTGALRVSSGTTGERPSPTTGMFRFNSSLTRFEGYNGASWGTLGGATGGGNDQIFYENGQNVTTNYTIASTKNAMSAGPITIDGGATVTVDTGANWIIV
jgi:hypothetical protein